LGPSAPLTPLAAEVESPEAAGETPLSLTGVPLDVTKVNSNVTESSDLIGKRITEQTNPIPEFNASHGQAIQPNGIKIFSESSQGSSSFMVEVPSQPQTDEVIIPVIYESIPLHSNIITIDESSISNVSSTWSQDGLFQDSSSNVVSSLMVNPMVAEGIEPASTDEISLETPDILDMLLNDTIKPDSQEFKDFVALDEPIKDEPIDLLDQAPSTSGLVKQEPLDPLAPPVKRGRGRPRLPRGPEPPRRPRGRPPTAPQYANVEDYDYDSASNLSENEVRALKHRRMRDLNNAASKRCRISRKRKFQDMEGETEILEEKNKILTQEVKELEAKVALFKKAVFKMAENKKKKPVATATSTQAVAQPQQIVTASNAVGNFDSMDTQPPLPLDIGSILSFDENMFTI